mmetsp:Transcript_34304/g.79165  ORF Transcript_34304/g.79165 Transcript_34304/m.79165 type:complete len:231 (-) Transcript_34304:930-1622(-)
MADMDIAVVNRLVASSQPGIAPLRWESEKKDEDDDDDDGLLFPPMPLEAGSDDWLLKPEHFRQLQMHLALTVQTRRVECAYSTERDGDAFPTLLEKCCRFAHTLIVMETTKGHLLGGYVTATWSTSHGRSFYGSGQSFLFATHPQDKKSCSKDTLQMYPWARRDSNYQMCNSKGQIAMGLGEEGFGFLVQDNLSKGFSNATETFASPSLVNGGSFDIYRLEIYGFPSIRS